IENAIATKLVEPTSDEEEDKVGIPGEGSNSIDHNGKVTFTPVPKFTGEGKYVLVKLVDKNGIPVTAELVPYVTAVT
ncbi:hypothetical protein, partial [Staphylococcus condimenti]|uniref:hypothetical protein n=1 Tax=Staphylococcus condimenti TaxID=70255 RepID=UPI0013EEE94A